MALNTEHLGRCIGTLEYALACYCKAPADSIEQDVFRAAIVKEYELVQETAFKLLKRALRNYGHTGRNLDATPIKDLLRLAASHGLMTLAEVERWFTYRDNRNNTAHEYGVRFATETLVLLPAFLVDARTLAAMLGTRMSNDE